MVLFVNHLYRYVEACYQEKEAETEVQDGSSNKIGEGEQRHSSMLNVTREMNIMKSNNGRWKRTQKGVKKERK